MKQESNRNWFGEYPNDWKLSRIKNVCVLRSQPASAADPYLGLEDLNSFGDINPAWNVGKGIAATGDGNLCLPGDVIFSKLRVYLAKGTVAHRRLRCTSELIVLRPTGIDAKYLNAIFKSSAFITYLDTASYGTKMPRISPQTLLEALIPMPTLAEQQRIVSYLEAKMAEIDTLVMELRRERKLLERYRRELIAHAVTRGLNPDAPMRDSGIRWISEVPTDWDTSTISVVTDENKARNSDLTEKNLLSLSYGQLIRKDINLAGGLLPASFGSYQIVEPGYIILRMTDLQNDKRSLRSAQVKERGIITSAYIGLKVRGPILSDYLSWLLRFYDLTKVFYSLGGGVRQSANYKEIGKIPIIVPPVEEQYEISAFLKTKSAQIDSIISGITHQIELLGKYRKQLINDAVTGKIRVGEVA